MRLPPTIDIRMLYGDGSSSPIRKPNAPATNAIITKEKNLIMCVYLFEKCMGVEKRRQEDESQERWRSGGDE